VSIETPFGARRVERPLVTVGIPAYDRPAEVQRAVRSALAQDHPAIEVLVSDDASPDPAVETALAALAASDVRVRYVRQPRNLGHAGNYQWVLENARGEYFMWLSDDDWIDPDYVSRCVAALEADSTTVLVCGLARCYEAGVHVLDERPTNLDSGRAGLRLIRYFSRVSLNGALFGLARRERLLEIGFPQVVGGDWMLIAAVAARGRIRTLDDVHIYRSLTGLGADASQLARSFGLSGVMARRHHVLVAARIWADTAFGAGPRGAMGRIARIVVATIAAASIIARFTLAPIAVAALGPSAATKVERRISAWLRARESG
jgi:glycosyltransferase involved in cell wall biosynthesis